MRMKRKDENKGMKDNSKGRTRVKTIDYKEEEENEKNAVGKRRKMTR